MMSNDRDSHRCRCRLQLRHCTGRNPDWLLLQNRCLHSHRHRYRPTGLGHLATCLPLGQLPSWFRQRSKDRLLHHHRCPHNRYDRDTRFRNSKDRNHLLVYRIRYRQIRLHQNPCTGADCKGIYHQDCFLPLQMSQKWRHSNQHRSCHLPRHHPNLWTASSFVGTDLHVSKYHRCLTNRPHRNQGIHIDRIPNDHRWYRRHRLNLQNHRVHNHRNLECSNTKFLNQMGTRQKVGPMDCLQTHPYQNRPIGRPDSVNHQYDRRRDLDQNRHKSATSQHRYRLSRDRRQ